MGADDPQGAEARGPRFRHLQWRCRRGMLELDLLLKGFLAGGYGALDAAQQAAFERLLALPDQELLDYLLGMQQAKDGNLAHVIARIRDCAVS